MSLLYFTGFEYGSDTAAASTASGTGDAQASVVKTGGWAYQSNPTTTGTGYVYMRSLGGSGGVWADLNVATLYATFDFYVATLPASDNEDVAVAHNGSAVKAELRINSSGYLLLTDASENTLGTSASPLSSSTWYRIDMKIGTGTDAPFEVRVNGLAVITGTSSNISATNNNRFYLGKLFNRNSNTVDFIYDNLILSDSAYATSGAVVQRLSPNGDGTASDWEIGSGSGNDWENVDELSDATDTTYLLSTGSVGDASLFTMQNCADVGITGTILAVLPRGRINRHGASNGSVKLRFITYDSDAIASTSTASYTGRVYEVDPRTSAAWTTSGVDSVEFGYVENDATNLTRLYNAHLMVLFVPAGGACTRLFRTRSIGLSPF